MIEDIKTIAEEVLYKLNKYSDDALAMIIRTGNAETGYRKLIQYGGGPGLGFFQVELATAQDILDNYVQYRPAYLKVLMELGLDSKNLAFSIKTNIALQIAFCRLHYMRDKNPIPSWSDLEGQASYWKEVYNTHLGKGTIKHFIEANEEDF
tara:strand:+ start:1182 stop:1634 length:453 start_codon:yes stop_codon:yes gene_type:complete